jgi:hypothetical protein
MRRDYDLLLSDAQALTATAASTNYIGDWESGGDEGFFLFKVDTILDSAGDAAVLALKIESDSDSGFATNLKNEWERTGITEAELVAGFEIKIPVPLGMQANVRGYYTVTTENFTSGNVSLSYLNGVDHDNKN